jgi:hypothetical protein
MRVSELTFSLNTYIAEGREGALHMDPDAPRHLKVDSIKVQSSYLDPMTTYAIGVVHKNELHLTPLAGVYQVMHTHTLNQHASPMGIVGADRLTVPLQMRPSVEHVDAAGDPEVAGEVDDEESEEEGASKASSSKAQAALQPLKLRHIDLKKRESDKAAAVRGKRGLDHLTCHRPTPEGLRHLWLLIWKLSVC